VLLIRGAFAGEDVYNGLPASFRDADVLLAHLPGMHTPFLAESTVAAMAAAFDEACAHLRRRPHLLGFSMGGIVALAMKQAASILAVDPPLQTAPLWPLIAKFRREGAARPELREWLMNLFGVAPNKVVNRDYRPLVDEVQVPLKILIAGEPLEPERFASATPGLITAEDRRWLLQHPKVDAQIIEGVGHNIPGRPDLAIQMVSLFRNTVRELHRR
jgi:hypothetical protein